MNLYGIIILSTIGATFVINLIGELYNLRTLTMAVPREFGGVYNGEAYAKAQQYTRARSYLGIASSIADVLFLLLFWFGRGFATLDSAVWSWSDNPVVAGMLYIGILFTGKSLLSLPFSIYSTFVIEERFGFNRTTPATFLADRIKGLLLALVFGAPLLAAILSFFLYAGSFAWLYCWVIVVSVMLVVQCIAPTWIMPLFNRYTPLTAGELRSAILEYARRVNFPLEDIHVMDGSKRSAKSNAFFTGFGKHKRIALFDTLISKQTIPEVVAILAHEIGHYKKKHIIQSMFIGFFHTGVLFAVLSIVLSHDALYEAFYIERTSVHVGLVLFGLMYSPVEFVLSLALNAFSRRNEFQADRFAAETAGRDDMIAALKKLSVDNLSHLTPHPLHVMLHNSHPPVLNRIRALQG